MRPHKLTQAQLADALEKAPNWQVSDDGLSISRLFQFGSYLAGADFVAELAQNAQAADHHPDIELKYKKVNVIFSTHDAGGLTQLDFAGAAKADSIFNS